MMYNLLLKKNRIIIGTLLVGLIMFLAPEVSVKGTNLAISLWMNNVIPSLLPFFIFANFLKGIGVLKFVPIKIYPIAMGCLSGYPMGAKVCGDIYRDGMINEKELRILLSYSMITSPAFIIGTVGSVFLKSYTCGIIILVAHYLSGIINGSIEGKIANIDVKVSMPKTECSYYDILTDAILESFKSVGMILAYIVMFMVLIEYISKLGIFSLYPNDLIFSIAKGFLEMTVGCNELSKCSVSMWLMTGFMSLIVTFGGMSIICQSMAMLRGTPITIRKLIRIKVRQSLIAGLIGLLLGTLIL